MPIGRGKQFLDQKNWLDRDLLGGWSVSTIITSRSGSPVSAEATDLSNTGTFHDQRADQICDPNTGFHRSKLEWFNTACFTQSAIGRPGNIPRDNIRGPWYNNTDISAFKSIAIGEGKSLQIRSDFFHAFNVVTYRLPMNYIASPVFGQIISYGPARAIQTSLKVVEEL